MKWQIAVAALSISMVTMAQVTHFRISNDGNAVQERLGEGSTVETFDLRSDATSKQIVVTEVRLLRNNSVLYSELVAGLIQQNQTDQGTIDQQILIYETQLEKAKSKKQLREYNKIRANMKKLKKLQDKMDHSIAYLRALLTCIEQVPVSNESKQNTTMGIQSSWCQQMLKSDDAKSVADILAQISANNTSTLYDLFVDFGKNVSNRELVAEVIKQLVSLGRIKLNH